MSRIRGKLSTISRIHYIKLVVRSLLFLAALAVYVVNRLENSPSMFGGYEDSQLLLLVLTVFFSVEMVLRCFPSKYESMGCQKQFAKNYISTGQSFDRRELRRLQGLVQQKGLTLIPLSLYFSGSHVKMEVGLCRGKKLYDKRDSEAARQAGRDMERHLKGQRTED